MPAGNPRDPAIDLLDRQLAFLDRDREHGMICTQLSTNYPARVVIVLRATRMDRYRYFIHRLVADEETKNLAIPRYDLGPIDALPWRHKNVDETLKEVTRKIHERLHSLVTPADQPAATPLPMSELEGAVIFSCMVDEEIADPPGPEYLRAWFKYFGQECPVPGGGQSVAILCVIPNRSEFHEGLHAAVTRAASILTAPTIIHIEKLPTINATQFDRWVNRVVGGQRDGIEDWASFLRHVGEQIFTDKEQTELPLSTVGETLLRLAATSGLAPRPVKYVEVASL